MYLKEEALNRYVQESIDEVIEERIDLKKVAQGAAVGSMIFAHTYWGSKDPNAYKNREKQTISQSIDSTVNKPVKNAQKTANFSYSISDNCINLIKKYEKLKLTVYHIKGESSNTVGWGHKIKPTDPLYLRKAKVGSTITREIADNLLKKDIETIVIPALNKFIPLMIKNGCDPKYITQGFIDGFGSMIYNCGETSIRNSEFYRTLMKGNIQKAIAMVPKTKVFLPGHKSRRMEEYQFMKS